MAETSVDDLLKDLLGDEGKAPEEAGQHASFGPLNEEAPFPGNEQVNTLETSNAQVARAELIGHASGGAWDQNISTQGARDAQSPSAQPPDLFTSEPDTKQLRNAQQQQQQQQQQQNVLSSPEASTTGGSFPVGKSAPAGGDAQQFAPDPNDNTENDDMLEGLDDVFGPTTAPTTPQAENGRSFGDDAQQQQQQQLLSNPALADTHQHQYTSGQPMLQEAEQLQLLQIDEAQQQFDEQPCPQHEHAKMLQQQQQQQQQRTEQQQVLPHHEAMLARARAEEEQLLSAGKFALDKQRI
ncbi:hypothetical protein DUNSADRAFT_12299 [Dunaliella salina]|uniref:Uncharacterized protein n=1 Tax=Dunaliella salina TaxID=3046 RepID=A0ABQ7H419_DUNSA|nr:hypothetical protein DUNSADRAFT_12299 [Dunaliella salina]|eukprot:KAF5841601.1 hypothetical protein DUNSADRAFT_12299 [Dunaliella salina]